jgi:hypothetical protein
MVLITASLRDSADSFFKRSDFTIAFEALWGYLPMGIVKLMQRMPTTQLKRLRKYMSVARGVAKKIVDTQTQAYIAGNEGGKDIMSVLSKDSSARFTRTRLTCYHAPVRANLAEDPKNKLGEAEVMAQLTLVFMPCGKGYH